MKTLNTLPIEDFLEKARIAIKTNQKNITLSLKEVTEKSQIDNLEYLNFLKDDDFDEIFRHLQRLVGCGIKNSFIAFRKQAKIHTSRTTLLAKRIKKS